MAYIIRAMRARARGSYSHHVGEVWAATGEDADGVLVGRSGPARRSSLSGAINLFDIRQLTDVLRCNLQQHLLCNRHRALHEPAPGPAVPPTSQLQTRFPGSESPGADPAARRP